MSKGERFTLFGSRVPGPGTYEQLGEVSKIVQHCGNFHSPKVKNIGNTGPKLHVPIDNKSPGPGTYRQPSDFGYVDLVRPRKLDWSVMIRTSFTQKSNN
jgi:hypothetical protein